MLKATEARAPSTTNLSILKEQGKNTDKKFRGKKTANICKKKSKSSEEGTELLQIYR